MKIFDFDKQRNLDVFIGWIIGFLTGIVYLKYI